MNTLLRLPGRMYGRLVRGTSAISSDNDTLAAGFNFQRQPLLAMFTNSGADRNSVATRSTST
jgi:hypothetical protein